MTEERATFRYAVGIIAILGGLGGLAGLYFIPIPTENKDALLLALGVVMGWGTGVVNGEWGSSPAGRQAAAVGMRIADQSPQEVTVTNTEDDPVPTAPAKRK